MDYRHLNHPGTASMQGTLTRHLLPLLAVLALAPAQGREQEPLKPTEAYRYTVADTGDALEVDWAIEEGYYLYRDKLSFESGTGAVVLGEPRLPEGLPHEDEFFGKQQIYREHFYVSIPYRIDGPRPPMMQFTIKAQGCADMGICYPPQTWTETVALKQDSESGDKLDLAKVGHDNSSEFLPVDAAFVPSAVAIDGNRVELDWRISPGYYLYKDRISVIAKTDNVGLGQLDLPDGQPKHDEFVGDAEVYHNDVSVELPVARATPEAMDLELEVTYQGCAEAGLCYPPTTRTLTVALPKATAVSALPPRNGAVTEQDRWAKILRDGSLWVVIASFFGGGLLLAFTPCVLPMVPILVGIIAGDGDKVSSARGFALASSYVLGMAIVYTAAGIAAALAGSQLQAAFNQPWVIIVFAGLFVLLAIAMFGGYDLQMPSAIQTRLAAVSGRQKSGSVIGAFIMGALSSLVVTACVAPILIAALTMMAQTGDVLRGGLALFSMSLGMGAPLLLVGAAQGHFLPKVGPWMVRVKGVFGFMLLGVAVYLLTRIVPAYAALAMWALLTFMAGVFLGGLTTLTPESSTAQKLGKGFGFLAVVYGLLLGMGALAGGSDPFRPFANLNITGGAVSARPEAQLEFRRIKTVDELDRAVADAAAAGKSVMLDFYADWCVSCKEMEAYTFTDSAVQSALAGTVLLQADVTANDEDDQALLKRFGIFGPPWIVFFGADGARRDGFDVVGYMKAQEFVQHLRRAFSPDTEQQATAASGT
jgi:thioredoxin:protein disulfide reductase